MITVGGVGVTDLTTASQAGKASGGDADEAEEAVVPTAPAPSDGSAVYAWGPAEPAPKKKRTAVWISAAAGVVVVGLVVSSLVLIGSSGVMWSHEVKEGLRRHKPSLILYDSLGSNHQVSKPRSKPKRRSRMKLETNAPVRRPAARASTAR